MSNHTPKPIQIPLPIEGETIEIPLTKGYVTIVDAIDADLLNHKWSVSVSNNGDVYVRRTGRIALHRLILERIIGRRLEKGEVCDHKNNNTLDNRRSNIRLATWAENCRNCKPKHGKVGLKGVTKWRGKYLSQIMVDYKTRSLGMYETAEEAHEAYCKAAKELHGEFARLE